MDDGVTTATSGVTNRDEHVVATFPPAKRVKRNKTEQHKRGKQQQQQKQGIQKENGGFRIDETEYVDSLMDSLA